MFRPAYVNVLGRENRPGRPLHKETRRRIIDRYLTREGRQRSPQQLVELLAQFIVSFDVMKRLVHLRQPRRVVCGVHLKTDKGENICNTSKLFLYTSVLLSTLYCGGRFGRYSV